MDGIGLNDIPTLAAIAAGFAAVAVLILWLPERLPFVRGQALALWVFFALLAVSNVVWSISRGAMRFSDFGFLAMALVFLGWTWRRRNAP